MSCICFEGIYGSMWKGLSYLGESGSLHSGAKFEVTLAGHFKIKRLVPCLAFFGSTPACENLAPCSPLLVWVGLRQVFYDAWLSRVPSVCNFSFMVLPLSGPLSLESRPLGFFVFSPSVGIYWLPTSLASCQIHEPKRKPSQLASMLSPQVPFVFFLLSTLQSPLISALYMRSRAFRNRKTMSTLFSWKQESIMFCKWTTL